MERVVVTAGGPQSGSQPTNASGTKRLFAFAVASGSAAADEAHP
jgi:hypothetical protein